MKLDRIVISEQEETRKKVKINKLVNFDKQQGNDIKVSIIIPVCNVERYLKECLDSVVNQTLRDIEIICVNDGSTDNSETILEEYASNDYRVKIIDKENAGYGHAMNIGMDMAKGEYIGIVESDDYVDAHMYEELYNIAKKHNVDYVKCDFNRFIDIDGERNYTYMRSALQSYYGKVINIKADYNVFKFNVQTWTGLYNREFLFKYDIRHNETPGASFQDNGFYYKTFCCANKIYFLNKGYYFYRFDNPNSSIHNKGKTEAIKKEFDLILDYAQKNSFSKIYIDLYYWKKFKSYLYTIERIGEDLKKEFYDFFANELKNWCESNYINRSLFSSSDLEIIDWILKDPEEYYSIRIKQQKISVIVPTYNVEKYINECLDSIISQTLKEIEIICINDGSTDKSLSKLLEYKKIDKRIIVLNQLNIGVGATRNRGIDMAHGEFVIFMDPDDYYPSNDVLETLYNSAKKYNVNIAGGSFSDLINGQVNTTYKGTLVDYIFKDDGIYDYKDYQFDYGFHRFIYKTSMLRENKIYFPALKRYQDPPFFVKAMSQAGKFYGTKKTVYRYRRNSNSQNLSKEKLIDALNGVLINLELSSEQKLVKLHSISAQRLFLSFVKPIVKYLNFEDQSFLQLLNTVNNAVRFDLLDHKIVKRANVNFLWLLITEELKKQNMELSNKILEQQGKGGNDEIARLIIEQKNSDDKLQKMITQYNALFNNIQTLQSNKVLIENKIYQLKMENLLQRDKKMEIVLPQYTDEHAAMDELSKIKKSFSYKIGRFITWFPRTISRVIIALKKHGLKYVFIRTFGGKRKAEQYLQKQN